MSCSGSKPSGSSKGSGYTPKIKSAGKASQPSLPKGWATGSANNNFGTPRVRASFGGKK